MNTYRCRIPAWALNYLVNGDAGGITPGELETVRKWEASWDAPISVSPVDGELYFSSCPEFGLPCEVEDCEVLVHKDRQE